MERKTVENSAGQGGLRKNPAGRLADESGFVLVFAMFLLAICTILGMAATQTGVDEIDITTNEVIVKKIFSMAESGLPLASIPLIRTYGEGKWPGADCEAGTSVFLDDGDPDVSAASGVIEILDGGFLWEGRDFDMAYNTRWNNWGKYLNAPDAAHKAAYKPIDDPFEGDKAEKEAAGVDTCPDIRIRSPNLIMEIDVDKVAVKYTAGGVAEFGSGSDGAAGMSVKVSYVFNIRSTLPGKNIESPNIPQAEVLIGWGLLPTGI